MLGRIAISIAHLPESPGVYRIVNNATGESYVGGSVKVRSRCYSHAIQLANGDHQSRVMQKAYREHGADAFSVELIDVCDLGELSMREQAWIEWLSPAFNTQGRVGLIRKACPGLPRKKKTPPKEPRAPKPPREPNPNFLSHGARRERRRVMAERHCGGALIEDVAREFKVSIATVRGAVAEFLPLIARERRANANEMVSASFSHEKTAVDISIETGVPPHAVYAICKEIGIPLKRGRKKGRLYPNACLVSHEKWMTVDWGNRDAHIARELKVSRERVRQVRKLLGKPKHADLRRTTA